MTVIFDKLRYVRSLAGDGTFPREQAERMSEALEQALDEGVATKGDIVRLEANLEGRLAAVDVKLASVDVKLASVDVKLSGMEASIANLNVWAAGLAVAMFSGLSAIRFFGH